MDLRAKGCLASRHACKTQVETGEGELRPTRCMCERETPFVCEQRPDPLQQNERMYARLFDCNRDNAVM
eukprot:232825-Prymnesium_polylepis.3